jgi:large subunit ribosomal protein L23
MNIYEVLRSPRITEKNTMLAEQNKYTFNVAREATKLEIKAAVEKMFSVRVVHVNTINNHGEIKNVGRRVRVSVKLQDSKKAIVTLEAGQKISFFEAQ